MSTTITAVPFLLITAANIAVTAGLTVISTGIAELPYIAKAVKEGLSSSEKIKIHLSEEEAEELFSKDFQTSFNNKDLLIKTLEEHGAENIQTDENYISCDCEELHLEFFKDENMPYFMRISYKNSDNLDQLIDDINTEYRANAQEISYNKIKERLEAQNLSIEEEEIYDDNTIVLTVNLEE